MRWSKLKSLVEEKFAPSVSGKVRIYSTSYYRRGNGCQCGRGWITYNGEQIVQFETILYGNRVHRVGEKTNEYKHVIISQEARIPGQLSERGEWSRYELHEACRDLLCLSIDDAINSGNPLVRGLAFLDKRFGRRRVAEYSEHDLHPLPKRLLEIRRIEDSLVKCKA